MGNINLSSKQVENRRSCRGWGSEIQETILVAGAGVCGKTTFCKLLDVHLGTQCSKQSYGRSNLDARDYVHKDILCSLTELVKLLKEHSAEEFSSGSVFDRFLKERGNFNVKRNTNLGPCRLYIITEDNVSLLEEIWNSEEFKSIWQMREKVHVCDSLAYFMKDIRRIAADDYVATQLDILCCGYQRTIGLITHTLEVNEAVEGKKVLIAFFECGGQKSEILKAYPVAHDATSLVYIVSLVDYDQVMFGTDDEYVFDASIELFRRLLGYKEQEATCLLLFTKADVLTEKLILSPFVWEGFDDNGKDCNVVQDFIMKLFLDAVPIQQQKSVIPKVLNLLDVKQTQFKEIISEVIDPVFLKHEKI